MMLPISISLPVSPQSPRRLEETEHRAATLAARGVHPAGAPGGADASTFHPTKQENTMSKISMTARSVFAGIALLAGVAAVSAQETMPAPSQEQANPQGMMQGGGSMGMMPMMGMMQQMSQMMENCNKMMQSAIQQQQGGAGQQPTPQAPGRRG